MERAELAEKLAAWRGGRARRTEAGPCLVSETDPLNFMRVFAEAVAGEGEVFLCDPGWGKTELTQLGALLQSEPSTIDHPQPAGSGWLMIPTGGSAGNLKFARHDQNTIAAAVEGFTQFFALSRVNAAGVLPLHHVSGLMAWMRCVLTGGEYVPLAWKPVEQGELPRLPARPDGWVLSLVPTQLERLLRQPPAVAWLQEFRVLFLGGGAAWPTLLDHARDHRLPLSPGYGMTETAAMVAALRPEEFLSNRASSGRALPHATVRTAAHGTIFLGGASLFLGYYPQWRDAGEFETADVGQIDAAGFLTVVGRKDSIIISGGEKVNPVEVEAALRDTGEFTDIVVLGVPDAAWGQVVVAAFPDGRPPDWGKVHGMLATSVSPVKRPKRWLALKDWPVTPAGKVNRALLAQRVAEAGARAAGLGDA